MLDDDRVRALGIVAAGTALLLKSDAVTEFPTFRKNAVPSHSN
jgi:hypothetical protein